MKTKFLKYLALIALPGLAISCKDDKENNNSNDLTVLTNLYNELRSDAQEFVIQAGANTNITGAMGTVIKFYPNSFKDKNGSTVNSGNIKIFLTEVLDPKHMVANRVQTVTESNQLLSSGGAINIVATLNGDTLATNGYGIEFNKRNNTIIDTMALYPGYTTNIIGGNGVMWYDDTTSTTTSKRRQDPDSFTSYYNFDSCFDFGWVNCDYYTSFDDPKTNIGVVMPNNIFNSDNTEVIIVDKRLNVVATLTGYNRNSNTFMAHNSAYYLPVGEKVSIIVIGGNNGKIHADTFKDVILTNNHTFYADPKESTAAQVANMINEL